MSAAAAKCTEPFLVRQHRGELWRLTGASDFAARLERCPAPANALAYSEGDELSGCLDLLHLPAAKVWVEWNEAARGESLARTPPEWVPAKVIGMCSASRRRTRRRVSECSG